MAKISTQKPPSKSSSMTLGVIWTSRRNKLVLEGPVADRLDELLRIKCKELRVQIKDIDINLFYVQFVIKSRKTLSITEQKKLIRDLKNFTANRLRKEFPELIKMPSMWTTYEYFKEGYISQKERRDYLKTTFCRG